LNYSQTSISNLALGRIGARGQITDVNESTPNAVKVLAVWDAVFQEVLSERDWKFAKTRVQLQLSPVTPLYSYAHAWALPSDFLRFVRPTKRPHDRDSWWGWGPEGEGWYRRSDPPFWPGGHEYKIETLTAGWLLPCNANTPALLAAIAAYAAANTSYVAGEPIPYPPPFPSGRYALTNYGGFRGPAAITYIQLISDYTQLMPGFVNCLANRLAMELVISVTEDKQKFQGLEQMYRDSLNSSEAQNECMDYQQDEAGSESWERAGRYLRWW
jgi:hypothetical protein